MRSDVGREQLARAAVEGVACGLLDGLDALAAFAPSSGQLILVGGGGRSRAYRQVLADLSGREVIVPRSGEQVSSGACVQAAAVLTGTGPADVADAWDLRAGDLVEPGPGAEAAADVRAAYAALRDATG
jgi:xylulokinase